MKKKEKESRCAAADQHVDRISDVPEEIIHGILYRMDSPSGSARTSILSRRWLHLWHTYPVLEFRDSTNRRCWSEHQQKFRSFSTASSRRLYNSSGSNNLTVPMPLHAVRLSLPFSSNGCAEILRDHKLQHEISPIEISVKLPEDSYYHDQSNMPALCWNFSRTKVLKLVNFHSRTPGIDLAAVCTMESLEVLHLDSVSIGDETLCSLLSNVPNLRELSLIRVYDKVDLKSPLLQMEVLHLQEARNITRETLCSLLCNSPNLATLMVMESYGYWSKEVERLAIDLPNLKSLRIAGRPRSIHLSFSRWPRRLPLHIDAPNCLTLHYSMQDCRHLPNKIDIVDLASRCQCVFDLSSLFAAIPHSWFRELRKFLAMLVQSHPHLDLVLKVASLESLDQVESFDSIQPALVVQHLELATNVPKQLDVSTTGDALLNGFFRTCHPKFLSITRGNDDKPFFSKYICEHLLKRGDDVDSCSYCYDVKCWRHQLKDVKLKNDIDEQMIEISNDGNDELISSISKGGKITFELTWH